MLASEAYQKAYSAHYKMKQPIIAINLYLRIIKDFPDAPEARYSRQQLENFHLDQISSDDIEADVKALFDSVCGEKENAEREAAATREREEDARKHLVAEQERERSMILTSTQSIDGYKAVKYLGVFSGEIVIPNGLLGAFTSGTFFTVDALATARIKAMNALKKAAFNAGANAILAIDIDISELHGGVMVSANGTGVIVEPIDDTK